MFGYDLKSVVDVLFFFTIGLIALVIAEARFFQPMRARKRKQKIASEEKR